jgi:hypothetical protein
MNPPTRRASPASSIFRIVYRSHSRIAQDKRGAVLAEIFDVARTNNTKADITGALLITDHYLVQALEGEEAAVRSLYEHISRDRRHEDVTVVDERPVDSRIFAEWAMAQVSAAGHADIPLHSTEGGIGRGAPQPTTRDQAGFLKFMRNTVGADVV